MQYTEHFKFKKPDYEDFADVKDMNDTFDQLDAKFYEQEDKISKAADTANSLADWAKAATKPTYTKDEIGLGNVDNTADADKSVASAKTADKLTTARTINGTNFDGSGGIITNRWGAARTFTIGNTSKSVNGSANVSWSLAEVGVHVSTTEPTSSDGNDGDIWIVCEE